MTMFWYTPSRPSASTLTEYLAHLRPFGVRWLETGIPVTYQRRDGRLMAEIGNICVGVETGLIKILACAGIGEREQFVLAGSAEQAFERAPRRPEGWVKRQRGARHWWESNVWVPVRFDEEIGYLIARHGWQMKDEKQIWRERHAQLIASDDGGN